MSEQQPTDSVSLIIEDRLAWIRLSHPGKRNALTWRMYDQLLEIADRLIDDHFDVAAVVLRGDPENGFAAGTAIDQFGNFGSAADGVAYERRVGAVADRLLAIPVPVIALVEGAAVGAGLVLTCCADLVIAERTARFGAPIARTLGNCLPITVVSRLRDRLGIGPTTAMLLTGELRSAESLHPQGFITHLVEPGGLDEAARTTLRRISSCAPLTLRALKELGRRLDQSRQLPPDQDLLELCYGSRDFAEGVDAFLAGRRPQWTGS